MLFLVSHDPLHHRASGRIVIPKVADDLHAGCLQFLLFIRSSWIIVDEQIERVCPQLTSAFTKLFHLGQTVLDRQDTLKGHSVFRDGTA